MEIPEAVLTQISEGRVVLLLGAGASLDAQTSDGKKAPSTNELRDILARKFLGGKFLELPLNQVAELAISETDLATVQGYIARVFEDLLPTPAHLQMAELPWFGLATTNYDVLIERGYEDQKGALQNPMPLIEDGDRVEDNYRDPKHVLLLKLHGCITRTTDQKCPLILTTDQYVQYRRCRERLFNHLKEWGYEHPIVFVGHGLQDPDLRAVLLELSDLGEKRPRYYTVTPTVHAEHRRFWEQKKVTPLAGTFEDFISSLKKSITKPFSGLFVLTPREAATAERHIKVAGAEFSRGTKEFLESDVEYVRGHKSTVVLEPRLFYRGVNGGFASVEQGLDVRRKLGDSILTDVFLADEAEHANTTEFVLMKAHAGAGKSVLLRRIAWDAANDYEKLCLFLKPQGEISIGALREIISLTKERLFLFVDDAADRTHDLRNLAEKIGQEGKSLTVVMAERINEWNVSGGPVSPFITSEHELKYLTSKEIDDLLKLLAEHKSLEKLENASLEEQRTAFQFKAGRQLLVALHEATLSARFEDIIEDEYKNISPVEAQQIYLTICILNRLGFPVRAGIVARIHGVPFEDFKQRLFAPLERVVQADYDPLIRDYAYRARHPHIADIVFDRILTNVEERYDIYVRCLKTLNLDYTVDRKAFRQMIRARSLITLFPDPQMVRSIYDGAKNETGEGAYVYHQMGIYEMNRPGGDFNLSSDQLTRAAHLNPGDSTIKHSIAELKLKMAELSKTDLQRDKLLRDALAITNTLKSDQKEDSYAFVTSAKIATTKLELAIRANEPEPVIESLLKDAEKNLFEGLQRFPGDSYLLDADANLARLVSDDTRVLSSLKKAFLVNPRSSYLAARLAKDHIRKSAFADAKSVLEKGLDANPNDHRLRYLLAKLLLDTNSGSPQELEYHLARSFTQGDNNYDAQLLYGRQLYINGNREEGKRIFERLAKARVPSHVKTAPLYPLSSASRGRIIRLEATYGFIAVDGSGDWLHVHQVNVGEPTWEDLTRGMRVRFRIAFTMNGPTAIEVKTDRHY
jgi:Flp pilus assembly protein TadD/cold shock CspA family protein